MKVPCHKCGHLVEVKRCVKNLEILQGYCKQCKIYIKVKFLKCFSCGERTYHQIVRSEGKFIYYRCLECGTEKRAYTGMRASPQRRMMAG